MAEQKSANKQQFLLGLFGGIAAVAVIGLIIMAVVFFSGKKGEVAGEQAQNNQNNQNTNTQPAETPPTTGPVTVPISVAEAKTFFEKKDATVCKDGGKPVVYLFSTTWCPHCVWIKDTFDSIMKKYVDEGKIVAYHYEVDTGDDTLTAAKETKVPDSALAVYNEFNPEGSIPTFIFGCKYFRIGNGYEQQGDLNAEIVEFEALIKDLAK